MQGSRGTTYIQISQTGIDQEFIVKLKVLEFTFRCAGRYMTRIKVSVCRVQDRR